MNENCRFNVDGKKCTALKKMMCRERPDKRCKFWKSDGSTKWEKIKEKLIIDNG